MQIRKINSFPAPQFKSNLFDIIFYSDSNAMGLANLLILGTDNYIYVFNYENAADPLYKEYLRLVRYYYPEVPRNRNTELDIDYDRGNQYEEYEDYYLGMGNSVLIKKQGFAEKNIKETNFPNVMKYIRQDFKDSDWDLFYDVMNYIPQNVLFSYSEITEFKEILKFLKEKGFTWDNGKELNENDISDSTNHYVSVDCKNKTVGFINYNGENDLMFFVTHKFDVKRIIELTLDRINQN